MILWQARVGDTYVTMSHHPRPRGERLHHRWQEGATLEQIGREEGITRERVRALIIDAMPVAHFWQPRTRTSTYWHIPYQVAPEAWTPLALTKACQYEEEGIPRWGLARPTRDEIRSVHES